MYTFKRKVKFYQKNRTFLLNSYPTRNKFLNAYKKSYNEKEKAKQLFVQILCELNAAVCEGNLENFKNISQILKYVIDIESAEELYNYLNENTFTTKKTNIVILACEYNRLEILKYIFSNYTTIFEHLFKNESNKISPNDEDQNHHSAFYYCIRSDNTELLNTLMNEWPENYFENHSNELEEIVSKTYEELRLKNVILSNSMKYLVEEKLTKLRFFSTNSDNSRKKTISIENIKERIELVIDQIYSLKSIDKVNEEFLLILKYIALSIFTLKRQLKVFYDKLPWEEMEFVLVRFIICNTEDDEINMFYRVALNKFKILKHLNNFAKRLIAVKDTLKDYRISSLASPPKNSREEIIAQIIDECPDFEELYQVYHTTRDINTLNEMNKYVTLASNVDVHDKEGQLVIIRSLQVIGECVKNTLLTPKISCYMCDLILLSLPKNTRAIVINLRDSLSHTQLLPKRIESLQREQVAFFYGIQNDLKKIGVVIKDIYYENILKTMKCILEEVVNCKDVEELKQVVSLGNQFKLNTLSNLFKSVEFHMTEYEKFRSIIQRLQCIIPEQRESEKLILKKMEDVIFSRKILHLNTSQNFTIPMAFLSVLRLIMYTNKVDDHSFRTIIISCNDVLIRLYLNLVQPKDLQSLNELSLKLANSCSLRMNGINTNELEAIMKLIMEIFCIVDIQLGNIHWVSELKDKLTECTDCSNQLIRKFKKSKIKPKDQLTLKLTDLKNIATEHNLSKSLINTTFKNNQLLTTLEMLIFEILSILGDFFNLLEDNTYFLDEDIPLLIGKNLRNNLGYNNAILDIIASNPSIGLIVTAQKFVEGLDENGKKIGKAVIEDIKELKKKVDLEKSIISVKQKMFDALESGNLKCVQSCISQGADVHARQNDTWTTLHAAAKGGNLAIVKFLLDQRVNIQLKTIDDKSPLHIAAIYGRAKVVEFFVEQKHYDVDDKDETFKTPLHFAALNNHKATVETLLKHNANRSAKDFPGYLPLHYAVQKNHKDVVEILLKNVKNVDVEGKGGFTSLHMASERGYLELVKLLINRGANVGAETDKNTIPLHLASLHGYTEIVDILVARKCNVNASVYDGCTPLHYATEHGHKSVVDILLKNGANPNIADKIYNNTPLHYAAEDGYVDIVKALIDHKANINKFDIYNNPPLFYAVMKGHLEVVKMICKLEGSIENLRPGLHLATLHGDIKVVDYLISLKMDVNVADDDGNTPLHIAAFKGLKDIVKLLLKNKADVNLKNIDGFTPLLAAVSRDIFQNATVNLPSNTQHSEQDEVVTILLESGSDINVKENDGSSVMHVACMSDKYSIAASLISQNFPMNIKNYFGETPLILATLFGHKEVILLLIANGADIHCADSYGRTALHVACKMGFCDIVNIFLANNAFVNIIDKTNSTPLSHAIKCNHIDVVKALTINKTQIKVRKGDIIAAIENNNSDILEILLVYNGLVTRSMMNEAVLLQYALLKSHENVVAALIDNGTNINEEREDKVTPLYIVVRNRRENLVKLLLDKGADINCTDSEGATLLHTAVTYGNLKTIEILLNYNIDVNAKDCNKRTALELAVVNGYLNMVDLLISRLKMDINSKVNNDCTLLHIAAQSNRVEVIKYLVEEGADINIRNNDGSTPIQIAAREGHEESVKYFLSLGQDINKLGTSNENLLHTCAPSGNVNLAEYLIKNGVDINAQSSLGHTPLHIAVLTNAKIDFIKLLLEHGAVYNAIDANGRRPINSTENSATINFFKTIDDLFKAVRHNNLTEVKRCIKDGAIVNALNSDNATPLHIAAWKGYDEIVSELVRTKDIANVIAGKGVTPLHYAATFSHLKVCKTLLGAGAMYNVESEIGNTPLDFSKNEAISDLLIIIHNCFGMVSNKNTNVIGILKNIKDISLLKAIMNARNKEGKSLTVAAIINNFPEIDDLKDILQDDTAQLSVADDMMLNKRYDEAIKIYNILLKNRIELLGRNNPGTLDIEERVAKILYKQERYELAYALQQSIFERQKELLGEDSREALHAKSGMASVLYRQGRNEEALAVFQQVYEKQKCFLTMSDFDFLNTNLHMGLVLNALRKFDAALAINTKIFKHHTKYSGPNHHFTLSAQNNMAVVFTNQGEFEQAEKLYQNIYKSLKKQLGPTHPESLRAFYNIIIVLVRQEKHDEAVKAYEEILKMQERFLGIDHIDTLKTKMTMAKLLFKEGKPIIASKLLNSCLPKLNESFTTNDEAILCNVILKIMNEILETCGNSDITDIIKHNNIKGRATSMSGSLKSAQ